LNSLRSPTYGGSTQINGETTKIGLNRDSKIFKKRGKTLLAIGLSTTGEGAAVTLEVATSFPGRCLGAIDHEDDLKRYGLEEDRDFYL